jgi:hypothetical protein
MDGAGTHELVHHILGEATPDEQAPQAQAALYLGSLARFGMEAARRSPEAERFLRTLSCPTWRHSVAFPLELIIKP